MPDFRAGDMVEVKSIQEILATLDSKGTLEGLPFMPEMLQYCGQRFKVYKRADKTAHYIIPYSSRRMFRTVHLEGLRCGGEHHDGCDALCLLYWREAWLKKVDENAGGPAAYGGETIRRTESGISNQAGATFLPTRAPRDALSLGKEKYYCQCTEVLKASSELKWWDFRQYFRDLRSGNICLKDFAKWGSIAIINRAHQRIRGYRIYPFIDHRFLQHTKTPDETLNLRVGEYVQIKSLEEILQTLDVNLKNKGLLFTKELIPYCGMTTKVIKIVKQIVNEVDGEMIHFTTKNSVILEDVICTGLISDKRYFCPKSCYPYWREIWLKRV
jgi:hypothetical protein